MSGSLYIPVMLLWVAFTKFIFSKPHKQINKLVLLVTGKNV